MRTNRYKIGFVSTVILGLFTLQGCGDGSKSTKPQIAENHYQQDSIGEQNTHDSGDRTTDAKEKILAYINAHESKPASFDRFTHDNPFREIDEGIYLVKYTVDDFDMRFRTALFKVSGESVKELIRLEDIKEGPGGTHAQNIQIDRNNHRISYIQTNSFDDTRKQIVYDYAQERLIEQNHQGFPQEWELKDALRQTMSSDTTIKEILLTPQKGGVVVHVMNGNGSEGLKLYGLENPWKPQFEYNIIHDSDVSSIRNIVMHDGGKISFTMTKNGIQREIVYDYFHRRVVSDNGGGGSTENPKSLFQNYFYNRYTHTDGFSIKRFEKLVDHKYLVIFSFGYRGGDGHKVTGVYKIDTSVEAEKILSNENLDGGPGDTTTNIRIDRDEGSIKYHYTNRFSFPEADEERIYWYD